MNAPKAPKWGGNRAAKIRAEMKRYIIANEPPCPRCGQPILAEQEFDVDHLQGRASDGDWWDPTNLAPAHRSCNRRAGGREGLRRRYAGKTPSTRSPINPAGLRTCRTPGCTALLASFEKDHCPRHQMKGSPS